MIQMSINKRCVIDIGAHIGLTLIPISRVSSGQTHIHCFESSNTNFKFLKYHIKKIGNDIHDLSNILNEIKYDIIDKNNNIPKSFKLDVYLLITKYDKSIKKFVRNYF